MTYKMYEMEREAFEDVRGRMKGIKSKYRKNDYKTDRDGKSAALVDVISLIFKDKGYDVLCKEQAVVENWESIVGERVARVTICEKADKGLLYVRVTSAAWRQDLSYKKDDLRKSIARVTGCDTIKDIVFY